MSSSDPGGISTASSELLLQTLWNAIRTTNDIINECNNNNNRQQVATTNGSSSSDPRTSDDGFTAETEGSGLGLPPGYFDDERLTRWKLEPLESEAEGNFSSDFFLPPPVDFEGTADESMFLEYDSMVLPPPPPVFCGFDESVSNKMVSDDAASIEPFGLESTEDFGDARPRRSEESAGKVVGGLFSVRQVCAMFENDQMHVVRDAVDTEPDKCMVDDGGPVEEKQPELNKCPSETLLASKKASEDVGQSADGLRCGTSADDEAGGNSAENPPNSDADSAMDVVGKKQLRTGENDSEECGVKILSGLNRIKSTSDGTKSDNDPTEHSTVKALDGKVIPSDSSKMSPDSGEKSPDSGQQDSDCRNSALSEVDAETALTAATAAAAAAAAGCPIPSASVEDNRWVRGMGGGCEEPDGGATTVDSDGNPMPVMLEVAAADVDLRPDAEAGELIESTDALCYAPEEDKFQSGENGISNSIAASSSTGKDGKGCGRKVLPSVETIRRQVVSVNVSKSIEQTPSERHFISKTLTKTTMQETRATATDAMVTDVARKPTVTSTFAVDSVTTVENFTDDDFPPDFRDKSGIGEKSVERSGWKDAVENSEKTKIDQKKMKTKDRSIFDALLDEKETQPEKKCFSFFEQREATRIQTEKSPCDGTPAVRNIEVRSIPSVENSVNRENSSSDHSSSIPSGQIATERKEEILRLPRPTSLMVSPDKLSPNLSSLTSSPAGDSKPSVPIETRVGAPLATPEDGLEDAVCARRSRNSSVGPSRSRQSSVGPCRSRQSSVGSLLGFQLPMSSSSSGVSTHFVVVAIDFGTTYSGYAFSFVRDPDSIHMMRRWEGGDPGIVNQKTPTTLLLTSDGKFHSFGFTARDFYHDLDAQEAKKWLYFEKFKMTLHHNADLNKETAIKAANGKSYPALAVFSHALNFFKDHALQELSDQSSTTIVNEDIRWVITVPAIWKAPAKQFMRQAAYQAGIASPDNPNQLLIALEPEAASIYVRKLRLYQLMPDPAISQLLKREPTPDALTRFCIADSDDRSDEYASPNSIKYRTLPSSPSYRHSVCPTSTTTSVGEEVDIEGTNYMVVDCGGGTVDITVYEMESGCGQLKELHKATGGPYGSIGIDLEFEKLLIGIFGSEFIEAFRTKRPAGWVDLMIAFESRKRTASPIKNNPLNVSLPFSFIDYYKKFKGSQVENAIRKYGNKEVTWSSQGMLRLTTTAMRRLFQPTLDHIKQAVGDVLNNPNARDVKYMFLVGGFAESAILQMEMRKEFDHILKILIPQDVGLTILKGAVCFGLDPTVVSVRRCRMTYGVGVLNRFIPDKHPRSKMITKEGAQWCTDVFDKFVEVDQSVAIGETVVRSYTPAKAGQKSTIIHVYCTEKQNPLYITDPGVKRCGTLCLDLTDVQYRHSQKPRRREIQARMTFGDTEIKVTALDVATGKYVRAAIDFMNR